MACTEGNGSLVSSVVRDATAEVDVQTLLAQGRQVCTRRCGTCVMFLPKEIADDQLASVRQEILSQPSAVTSDNKREVNSKKTKIC